MEYVVQHHENYSVCKVSLKSIEKLSLIKISKDKQVTA